MGLLAFLGRVFDSTEVGKEGCSILLLDGPLTPEEQAECERLAQMFAGGKPLSEMVIEDRDPY